MASDEERIELHAVHLLLREHGAWVPVIGSTVACFRNDPGLHSAAWQQHEHDTGSFAERGWLAYAIESWHVHRVPLVDPIPGAPKVIELPQSGL